MTAQALGEFLIKVNSSDFEALSEEIKYNEKQLDRWEKELKEAEAVQDELAKAGAVNSDTYKQQSKEVERLRQQTNKYRTAIEKLQKTSTYSFGSMQKSFMNLVKAIGLFAVVRTTLTKSLDFYEQAEQLEFLAQKTGIAAEKLQELGQASKRFGGNSESSATTVENMRTNREEYTKAGISVDADPTKTLENVARKMEKLKSDTEKWQLADSLGIDEATTRMLIEGVDKYNESLKRGSKYKLYTKEDIQRMRDYRQIQQDIRDGTNNIFGAIYRMLLPAITKVAKVIRGVTDWLSEHEGAVKIAAVFIGIATAVGAVTLAVNILNAAIGFLMANPVVLTIMGIIAAITLVIIVIQDLITWINGGDAAFSKLWEGIANGVDWCKNKINEIINKIKEMWDKIPKPIKKLIGATTPIGLAYNAVQKGKQVITQTNSNPANAVPAGAQSTYYQTESQNQNNTTNARNTANTRNKNVNVGTINITTQASDPKGVARDVAGTLDSLDNGQIG